MQTVPNTTTGSINKSFFVLNSLGMALSSKTWGWWKHAPASFGQRDLWNRGSCLLQTRRRWLKAEDVRREDAEQTLELLLSPTGHLLLKSWVPLRMLTIWNAYSLPLSTEYTLPATTARAIFWASIKNAIYHQSPRPLQDIGRIHHLLSLLHPYSRPTDLFPTLHMLSTSKTVPHGDCWCVIGFTLSWGGTIPFYLTRGLGMHPVTFPPSLGTSFSLSKSFSSIRL